MKIFISQNVVIVLLTKGLLSCLLLVDGSVIGFLLTLDGFCATLTSNLMFSRGVSVLTKVEVDMAAYMAA